MKALSLMLLVACESHAIEITESQHPRLTCFGGDKDYALCIDDHSNEYVCFTSRRANTSFCLLAIDPNYKRP